MKIKVRTHPIDVYYVTGPDAELARRATQAPETNKSPCFTTGAFGADGFAWDTCEDFESDYRGSFPNGGI